MSAPEELARVELRKALRREMLAQRELMAKQLGPEPVVDRGYPRSKTMRFLTRRPGLAFTLLAESAAFLFGARHARSLSAVMAIARIMRSAETRKTRRPDV